MVGVVSRAIKKVNINLLGAIYELVTKIDRWRGEVISLLWG